MKSALGPNNRPSGRASGACGYPQRRYFESFCFEHARQAADAVFASKGATHAEGGQGLRRASNAVHGTALTIATGETKTRQVTLGVDAGARHVGIRPRREKEERPPRSEVALRQDITGGLLADRLAFRRARRNRKSDRAAGAPRFNNRVRSKHKGWLAPSVENRIQAHMSRIEAVCNCFPSPRS